MQMTFDNSPLLNFEFVLPTENPVSRFVQVYGVQL